MGREWLKRGRKRDTSEAAASRLTAMVAAWQAGRDKADIAREWGISRERVRQLLKGVGIEGRQPAAREPCSVAGCGHTGPWRERFERYLCARHNQHGRVTGNPDSPIRVYVDGVAACIKCGRPTDGRRHRRTRGMCAGCYSNWLYHNYPGRKQKVAEARRKWRLKRYHTDPEWAAKQRAYINEWARKRRAQLKAAAAGEPQASAPIDSQPSGA